MHLTGDRAIDDNILTIARTTVLNTLLAKEAYLALGNIEDCMKAAMAYAMGGKPAFEFTILSIQREKMKNLADMMEELEYDDGCL